ncbi:MAG: BON domain-containing protein [Zoogloeaceae bacterium]|jgi:osmotically-inducible protein OsmY|nr:BON domain-containing protein [Zoogloeaceae bacterium]
MKKSPAYPRRRAFLGLAAAGLTLPALQGCFGLALTGATMGVLAAVDRRSIGVQTDDEAIELKASARLSKDIKDKSHLNFTSYNRRVLITGEVPDAAFKSRVAEEVMRIENVQGVWNELVIAGNSSLASRTGDSYVTSKVKARFVDANQFTVSHVKVVTEAGAVFLLGIVNEKEAQAAIQVTRTTDGVRKVINLLQIASDAEIRRIEASLANSATSTGSGNK